MISYDTWLENCINSYFDSETPEEKQERIESHQLQYDEWRNDNNVSTKYFLNEVV